MSLLLDALNKGRGADSDGRSAPKSEPRSASLDADLELSLVPGVPPSPAFESARPEPTRAGQSVNAPPVPPELGGAAPGNAIQSDVPVAGAADVAAANERQARWWWQQQHGTRSNSGRLRRSAVVGVLAVVGIGVAASFWWVGQQGGWPAVLADYAGLAQTPPVVAVSAPDHQAAVIQAPAIQEESTSQEIPAGTLQSQPSSAPNKETAPVSLSPPARALSAPAVAKAAPQSTPSAQRDVETVATARPVVGSAQSLTPALVATRRPHLRVESDPLAALRAQADAALLAARWEDAQRAYEAWLERRPDDPPALAGLALALHRQQRWPEAWQAYQRAAQRWPENSALRSGALAVLTRLDPALAESRLRDWIADNPGDALAHAALGTLLARQQRWALALEPLQQAVRLVPEDATYHYNLALVLERLKRRDQALQHYRQSLALGDAALPLAQIERHIRTLEQELTWVQDTAKAAAAQ